MVFTKNDFNMKTLCLFIFCLLSISLSGQEANLFINAYNPSKEQIDSATTFIPLKDEKVEYRELLPYTGDKVEVHTTLKRWFVDSFPGIQNVIQIDDPHLGALVGKAGRKYSFKSGVNNSNFTMFFTVSIDIGASTVDMRIYNIYGSDKRRNNLQMYLEATNSMLNDVNFDQHSSVDKFDLDLTKSYFDYMKGKREKYNGKVLYAMDREIRSVFESAENVLK
ncbi:hypothetical protein CLV99_0387 [Sphingobacterium yanglingense]|uniref:DUF4468 domain-containing protein n=2 Tax=Sphingobacterium yanglingense TaxID=1437280 RepID=A0A4R6WL52_9SPHI|nr:hypothetical protein CLV99_0387 [Sphingobacterium yanglingense]